MRRNQLGAGVLAISVVFAALVSACEPDFQSSSRLDTLRVLGVRAEPASGTPGGSVALELVSVDAVRRAQTDAARPLQIAWLGGCHNPPGRQYFACYPWLTAIAERLPARAIDAPAVSGFFGSGEHFDLSLPDDVLSAAPRKDSDPVHFGVSYIFFAVCAGELRPRPDYHDRVPLDCVDPTSGAPLGRDSFVSGFSTIYTYEGTVNANPVIADLRFAGVPITPCASDADCSAFVDNASIDTVCGPLQLCEPRLSPCQGNHCPEFLVDPVVSLESAEPVPGNAAGEVLWANYYATGGQFSAATELVNDNRSGWIDDHGSLYRAPVPGGLSGDVDIWVTLNDQRGGQDYRHFQVLVQ